MLPSFRVVLALAIAAFAVPAAGQLACPASSTAAISCYCSSGRSGCAVGPAAASPVSQPQGVDTICVTVSGECSGATQSLFAAQTGTACIPNTTFLWLTSFRRARPQDASAQRRGPVSPISPFCVLLTRFSRPPQRPRVPNGPRHEPWQFDQDDVLRHE